MQMLNTEKHLSTAQLAELGLGEAGGAEAGDDLEAEVLAVMAPAAEEAVEVAG